MERNSAQLQQFCERYLQALTHGDPILAQNVIESATRARLSALDIYLQILIPAQVRLGELWEHHSINIAEEHLATQITLQMLDQLRQHFRPHETNGHRAVFTTMSGDFHYLGARVVADFFLYDGWEVDFLGTDTPATDLLEFVARRQPEVLGVSASQKSHFAEITKLIRALHRTPLNTKVILGGMGATLYPDLASKCGADYVVSTAEEALERGRAILGMTCENRDLHTYLREIGHRVQQLRKLRSMSQQTLATRAELDRTYISAVENGKQNSTIQALMKLAKALGVPIERLIVGETPHTA